MTSKKPKIGFIGQGWIGKNYANDFEARGYEVVRYALEAPYNKNKDAIKTCPIVFIAVPTPTTPEGFDDSIVRAAIGNTKKGTIVVVKSTLVPGTTESLAKQYKDRLVVCSPEFLVEKTAAHDAAHPNRNIIGIPQNTPKFKKAAAAVMVVLPKAPFELVCTSREAELIKYAGNAFLFTKVVFANIFHDISTAHGANWENISLALGADPRIGLSHLKVVAASHHPGAPVGRGAGGHCFIKDFKALLETYAALAPDDSTGISVLRALELKNIDLLRNSKKDLDLLEAVYGPVILKSYANSRRSPARRALKRV